MEESITVTAPAKINLRLKIVGRRRDGYHLLHSLLLPLSLSDEIRMRRTDERGIRFRCDPSPELLAYWSAAAGTFEPKQLLPRLNGPSNLVVRAAELLLEHADGGLEITLLKRLPLEAGLGGGSSDAAAVLVSGAKLLGLEYSPEKLYKIGALIGSDLPAMILARPALVWGRGEFVAEIAAGTPGLCSWLAALGLVVVQPGIGVSTAAAYDKLRQLTPDLPVADELTYGQWVETMVTTELAFVGLAPIRDNPRHVQHPGLHGAALRCSLSFASTEEAWDRLRGIAVNDFETAVAQPAIDEARKALFDQGARHVLLCGSGSACVGFFPTVEAAALAERVIRRPGWFTAPTNLALGSGATAYSGRIRVQ